MLKIKTKSTRDQWIDNSVTGFSEVAKVPYVFQEDTNQLPHKNGFSIANVIQYLILTHNTIFAAACYDLQVHT